MKTILRLAWRNLWRNRMRTMITVAAVFFGVLLSAFMSSMQEGSYDNYIDTIVNYFTGHLQIHKQGYWDEQTINNTFEMSDSLVHQIHNGGHITFTTPRLESFALASHGDITRGVMVIGIDPEQEDRITRISSKIKAGRFIGKGSREAIVAEDLARYLRIGVGDTLVLISQGYHGVTAAGLFRISGIISHPSPELNRVLVYLDISAGREFFSTGERSTSLIVMIDDNDRLEEVRKQLEEMLGPEFEVMTWKEIEPILIQQIESDRASGRIMKAILYVLIAFGILGTIMMMMAERRKEMGVLIAVGMQRHRLSLVLLAETFLIGLIGVAAGILASIPINYYFFMNPIPLTGQAAEMALDMGFDPVMKFSTAPFVYLNQAVTVFILTVLISVYPLVTVMKLRVMSALRA